MYCIASIRYGLLCTPIFSYVAVTKCWEEIPGNRPNFSKLVIIFSSYLEDIAGYIDFSRNPLIKESDYDQTQPQNRGVGIGYDHLNPTIVITDTTLNDNTTDHNMILQC